MPPTRHRPRARPPAFVVRKHDRNGRAYYVDRVEGGRTSRADWANDVLRRRLERAAYQAELARADAEERDRREAERETQRRERDREEEGGGEGGGGGGGDGPGGGSGGGGGDGGGPEDDDVDEDGVPGLWYDEDGVGWPAYEIEGEDETG